MKQRLTGLGVILNAASQQPEPPELPEPELDLDRDSKRAVKLWIKPGINPNRQRKGKSGEIPR